MKRPFLFVFALALAGLLTAFAGAQQSLGDYARQQRAMKPPAPRGVKEYTNDNLPTSGGLSTSGASGPAASDSASASTSAGAVRSKADSATEKDMAKLEALWRDKIGKQKAEIAQLQRELDVATKERNLMVADYYRRPAENLQRSQTFAENDKKNQAELDGKKQAVAAAQQKLDDMREELRKAGLPNSWGD